MNKVRQLTPERVKVCYRFLRAWLLSAGLRSGGDFFLSNEERQASGAMSIIVAVHDAPAVTQRCLKSLENFSGKAEVIIVDDGSRLEVVRRMLDPKHDTRPEKIQAALEALGKRVVMAYDDAA